MTSTVQVCRTLVRGGLLETARRKEIYVLVILTALMVAGAYSFSFFGVTGLDIFVKDMAFTTVGMFATILGCAIATRQIPEEISRRTIYPLLARPVSRGQLLLGKFVASWVMTLLCFLLLMGISYGVLLLLNLSLKVIFLQYLWLKAISFLWLSAMGICLSIYVSQGAALTLTLLLAFGSAAFTRTFLLTFGSGSSAINWGVFLGYGFMPHYSLFDISRKVVYGWDPITWWVVGFLTVYGFLISGFWLWVASLRFRKMAV